MPVPTAQKIRFAAFELDRHTAELYKDGAKLRLQGQPIAVLSLLLARPGELVSREEIRKYLWPEDTFVDFEHSLNTHIKKLRQVLDDSAETPRYIETLPRRGYRFIAQVEEVSNGAAVVAKAANAANYGIAVLEPPQPPQLVEPTPPPELINPPEAPRRKYALAALLVFAALLIALYWVYRPRTPVVTGIHQLTHTHLRKHLFGNHQLVTDGQHIYFNEYSAFDLATGGAARWKVPAIGGHALPIAANGASVPLESPDGSTCTSSATRGFGV